MDNDRAELALQAITQIEAQEVLVAMEVAKLPWMKSDDARAFHRKIHQYAFPKPYEEPAVITIEKMAAILNGRRSA